MRFKAQIQNVSTFSKLTASLASLGPVAWVRLNEQEVRFTIIPEQGTQVWAVLSIDTIFDSYTIQSAASNVINLEVPLGPLQRALKSAIGATSASIRLTKKDNIPLLSLTIVTTTLAPSGGGPTAFGTLPSFQASGDVDSFGTFDADFGQQPPGTSLSSFEMQGRERETVITQDLPVRVLSEANVAGIHEPRCREPDVHIVLPNLLQLKSVSDRFTRLAQSEPSGNSSSAMGPRLELSANMHGCLRVAIVTDALRISSVWTGLSNPELDPSQYEGGADGIAEHPSTRMKKLGSADGKSEEGWSVVRIDGKDWSKVMSVGRLGGRVIACFCNDHALILYVYLNNDDDDQDASVLTYYVSSYSA